MKKFGNNLVEEKCILKVTGQAKS